MQAQRSAVQQAELQGELVTAGFGIWRAMGLGRSSQWEAFPGTSSRVRGALGNYKSYSTNTAGGTR